MIKQVIVNNNCKDNTNIYLSQDHIDLLKDIKDGATVYDNINGREIFNSLLEIERIDKKLITIIFGNELREIIGEEQMINENNQAALCGAVLTKKQQQKLVIYEKRSNE